jgi:S-adenosylmethionine:tRNA ribosyltransferase-isomerase
MYRIEEFDYDLPPALIAQWPAASRDGSRLLFVERERRRFSGHLFSDLPALLKSGDTVVVNDTKVVPARLFGQKATGGRIELLVLDHPAVQSDDSRSRWCLVRSSKHPKMGQALAFGSDAKGSVEAVAENGLVRIRFEGERPVDRLLEEMGRIPLPPYIRRNGGEGDSQTDRERYQTVFSRVKGAVAAPTAGLHFTENLIMRLREAGIDVVAVTLHVGYGTFRPVRVKDIRQHEVGEEAYRISEETASTIERTRKERGRVIAVGTTVVRALESAALRDGTVVPTEGKTNLLVTPGYGFRVVQGLITNFHLPRSSLLFLVSAFAGLDLIREAYTLAIRERYRFYSYGDAMLIL